MTTFQHQRESQKDAVDTANFDKQKRIMVLYNDDVNTFDYVIDSLIRICKHSVIQAEQCTWLVHHKGKCEIKSGSYEFLQPMCTALVERGLRAEII